MVYISVNFVFNGDPNCAVSFGSTDAYGVPIKMKINDFKLQVYNGASIIDIQTLNPNQAYQIEFLVEFGECIAGIMQLLHFKMWVNNNLISPNNLISASGIGFEVKNLNSIKITTNPTGSPNSEYNVWFDDFYINEIKNDYSNPESLISQTKIPIDFMVNLNFADFIPFQELTPLQINTLKTFTLTPATFSLIEIPSNILGQSIPIQISVAIPKLIFEEGKIKIDLEFSTTFKNLFFGKDFIIKGETGVEIDESGNLEWTGLTVTFALKDVFGQEGVIGVGYEAGLIFGFNPDNQNLESISPYAEGFAFIGSITYKIHVECYIDMINNQVIINPSHELSLIQI